MYVHPFQFIVHSHPVIQHCRMCVAESIVKETTRRQEVEGSSCAQI